jgi:hypothetical protein
VFSFVSIGWILPHPIASLLPFSEGLKPIDIDPTYAGDLGHGVFALQMADVEQGGCILKGSIQIEIPANLRDIEAS